MKEDGSKEADASLYRSLVGSLLYLTSARANIMYATSLLSRFMHNPSQIHVGAAKRVLRYIQGTLDFGILYEKNVDAKLFGFCDSDWAGCVDDMRSTSGCAFSLGSGVFSWASKKQETVAQSSAEAKGKSVQQFWLWLAGVAVNGITTSNKDSSEILGRLIAYLIMWHNETKTMEECFGNYIVVFPLIESNVDGIRERKKPHGFAKESSAYGVAMVLSSCSTSSTNRSIPNNYIRL
ncbi:uncharacterized mitochondrial protein AtMg00810-like [Cornus florida]|uniref:uncharacterized mitochondrial protein AtMg00810-like n=1 Tax=Cornus florida TaxID=4283 RepID=UPI002897E1FC|nr:uncharacterized mitochondrial protein AtMg00810-like [Cornus florida]